jgi:hypothetical protein
VRQIERAALLPADQSPTSPGAKPTPLPPRRPSGKEIYDRWHGRHSKRLDRLSERPA